MDEEKDIHPDLLGEEGDESEEDEVEVEEGEDEEEEEGI